MVKNATQNGTAATDKKEVAKTVPALVVTTPTKPQTEIQTPKAPTVEDVRLKNIRLTDLFDKEKKLLSTRSNLQTFRTASNESTNTLEISDGYDAEFKTHNPQVIGSIIELIKKDIEQKLEATQAEILTLA